jgi:hypothetical protein
VEEIVAACFKVQTSICLKGMIAESGYPLSGPKFEVGTYRIRIRVAICYTATLDSLISLPLIIARCYKKKSNMKPEAK